MEAFIRSDQFNFIQVQAQNLIYGHSTVNDTGVIRALHSITEEKVFQLFEDLNDEQREILALIRDVKDQADAALFLSRLKPFVIPFPSLTGKMIEKLFPKVKKLKVPSMEGVNRQELSYLGWDDHGAGRKYIVTYSRGQLVGIEGDFVRSNQKSICSVCNGYEKVGLFTTTSHKSSDSTVKKGNYICQNSFTCNHNLTKLQLLDDFIQQVTH